MIGMPKMRKGIPGILLELWVNRAEKEVKRNNAMNPNQYAGKIRLKKNVVREDIRRMSGLVVSVVNVVDMT
jgi:hypothetical protein